MIGSAYVGAGLVLWAIALLSDGNSGKQNDEDDPYAPFMHMAEGFAAGLEAGRAAREAGASRRA
ncbi:hypothetical protein RGUI_2071 [Rhodovulum sp. P5]|nr:hypothetical protein RGUI_2071 [Rhodovulum sp. P5]